MQLDFELKPVVSEEYSEENDLEIIKDEETSYTNDDIYDISFWGADYSFREIISMYDEEELVKPDLQRKYVWDKAEASRFIESILLGFPIPSIFLAQTSDNRKLIIDGYQRIMTVYDFVKGIWTKDERVFRLENKAINEKWRNKAFVNLSDTDKRKIRSSTIHAIIFDQRKPDNDSSLYQIFERINTGGRALMPQEIRHCINQGPFNTLLHELNKYPRWRILFGKEEDSRMRDIEMILRFFALRQKKVLDSEESSFNLKKLLDEYMSNKDLDIESHKNTFKNTIDFIYKYVGENAFFNIYGEEKKIRRKFHPTIFDSIMIATSIATADKSGVSYDPLEESRLSLLSDPYFLQYITEGTMQKDNIRGRINMVLNKFFGKEL